MVPSDSQKDNVTINNILVVRGRIVTPTLSTSLLRVGSNLFLAPGATTNLPIPSPTPSEDTVTLHILGTSNQIMFGPTNEITFNVDTTQTGTINFPPVSGTANVVLTEGTQTINGSKTFTSPVSVSSVTNQIVLGTGNTVTLTSPAPVASRTYTIPDVGGNASFLMGTSTISQAFVSDVNYVGTFNVNSGGLLLPTLGGTQTMLTFYESTQALLGFTGPFVGTQNLNVQYGRIGDVVTITIPGFSVAAAGAAGTIVSAAIPSRFRPSADLNVAIRVTNNSDTTGGTLRIGSSGVLTVFRADYTADNMFVNFANTGSIGIFACTASFVNTSL